jgi:hypothetical protein
MKSIIYLISKRKKAKLRKESSQLGTEKYRQNKSEPE